MYLRLKHGCILIEERYKEKALELNGPEFDWLHSPVDVKALYQCSCGRPHSKWTIFNGIVNDGEALPELKKSRASVAKCQRQLEEERARKEAYESRLAKEYAQRMFDWGKIVLNHNDSMQKFMEAAATLSSAIREETPDETLSRIATGVFRSHVNTTTSGGGNYSPLQGDDFPMF
ncbi:hypothetical protein PAHAL_6G142900 [Panicum hallii]|uniref:Uncharacterized protein n=1 Tax=Panicum hallii TaxID=206008 RepID=A0A2S3I1Q6_9POAL|nr:hypothetical protein PAHAL_6G142900 [Panicum hallii]PVH36689.1 hypothetical protein PAHAL_6G142900 [Panicum hallii]